MLGVEATHCPDCGGELGTTAVEGRDRTYCPACEQVWWRSSVPTTSVAVVDAADADDGDGVGDDEVLLIQRGYGRDEGRWDLPAGHPEYDEPAREAAARELREETGLAVDPGDLELVGTTLSAGPRATYRSINYRVDRWATDGSVTAGSDADDARFVDVETLGAGDLDVRRLGRLRLRCAGIADLTGE